MANRISVASQALPIAGLAPTFASPTADGDVIDCGRVMLMVNNTDSVAWNVTVNATAEAYGLDVEDLTASVAAGKIWFSPPLPANIFGQPSGANASGGNDTGRAYIDYASSGGTIASLKRAVVSY